MQELKLAYEYNEEDAPDQYQWRTSAGISNRL
eukprot:CAMPEP_0176179736 /NCGR_PEP_ID=MMETSP0120_2-20121206/92090_1 /TAXON_ID=160619 /ORGANISM="Kryptoperidinium foliaceum, Strain CCMP 1326" /LENGTH=31 /DNA_ID= /DNA_START= /DNA_END= /DNA_ORIENTATION=